MHGAPQPEKLDAHSRTHLITRRQGIASATAAVLTVLSGPFATAEPVKLEQPYTDKRPFSAQIKVQSSGHLFTSRSGGQSERHTMTAAATYEFIERRLPPGGRDAQALRAVRDFQTARMEMLVSDKRTTSELLPMERVIVSSGRLEGVSAYSPTTLLSRDSLDLLELPADPLILTALLPAEPVEIGAEWTPPEWVSQMFAAVEAVEKVVASCKLESINAGVARISVQNHVRGQRLGANTDVKIVGTFDFDTKENAVSGAALLYETKSTIGTITPGIDGKLDVTLVRRAAESPGRLADSVLEQIPVEAPAVAEQLVFHAAPWHARLRHDRNWHVFQAVLDGAQQVVILRRIDRGSLVCQCNVTNLPAAPAGQHAPQEQFDKDIERSLGARFKQFGKKQAVPTENGRFIYRVEAEGMAEITGNKGAVEIPMTWIYYLIADPSGRQMSFVFAVETSLLPQMEGSDLEMVKGVQFLTPR